MKKVIVLGASLNTSRYSNMAIKKLKKNNYDVYALGNSKGEVAGVKLFSEFKMIEEVYAVTIYLNPFNQKQFYDYILDLKPGKVVFNPGAENIELELILNENEIQFERACSLVLLSLNSF